MEWDNFQNLNYAWWEHGTATTCPGRYPHQPTTIWNAPKSGCASKINNLYFSPYIPGRFSYGITKYAGFTKFKNTVK
jgi:hypothetical protein